MRIIVDGDACPKINLIEQLANKYDIEIFIFCDYSHNINSERVIYVDIQPQNTDIKIINFVKENDIVVTEDIALAALCLNKNCYVLDPKGKIYNDLDIEILLASRNLSLSPKKRTSKDDVNLINNLEKRIINMIKLNR